MLAFKYLYSNPDVLLCTVDRGLLKILTVLFIFRKGNYMRVLLVNNGDSGPAFSASCLPLSMYHIAGILDMHEYEVEIFNPILWNYIQALKSIYSAKSDGLSVMH